MAVQIVAHPRKEPTEAECFYTGLVTEMGPTGELYYNYQRHRSMAERLLTAQPVSDVVGSIKNVLRSLDADHRLGHVVFNDLAFHLSRSEAGPLIRELLLQSPEVVELVDRMLSRLRNDPKWSYLERTTREYWTGDTRPADVCVIKGAIEPTS